MAETTANGDAGDLKEPRQLPLAGTRVLEFGQAVSSPLCAMLLGDLGADVIKIEPPQGDAARGYGPPFLAGESPYFLSCNRNKRGTVINIKHPEGAKIVRRLAESTDFIVTNFRPGVMERLGLGYDELSQVNPGLIFCQATGYGRTGPYAGQASYDQIAQGMSGLMSVTGMPDGAPTRVGVAIADCLAALHLTVAALGAFVSRQQTGLGQIVDTSLIAAVLGILTFQTGRYLATGESPRREGNDHPVASPYSAFPVKDGYVNIAIASEPVWRRFAEVVEHPEWIEDPRFLTNADRVDNRAEINAAVAEALSSDTLDNWLPRLNAAGIPCGPIWTIGQALDSDVIKQMGIIQETEHDLAGLIRLIGPAYGLSATPVSIRRPPPSLGQHSAEVLGELGYDDDAIQQLARDGAVKLGR